MKDKKMIAMIVILVVGVGVSAYLWTAGAEDTADTRVQTMMMDYKCKACGADFSMSVDEASAMRRNRGDIYCPHCGQNSSMKKDVKIGVGAGSFTDEEEGDEEERPVEDPKPKPGGGMKPVNQ